MRNCQDDTRQQPGNPSLFRLCQSYQAAVEFHSNYESSDSDLEETAEVIIEFDPESATLEESNVFERRSSKVQIISTFYQGNFQQKTLIINIVLCLRMSAYAYVKATRKN